MKSTAIRKVFTQGAISPEFIANAIQKHQSKTAIGAHNIFLGQVRADRDNTREVTAIEYSAYEDMANQKCHEIKEAAIKEYGLSCLHIHHSTGVVRVGEICFFVFVSAPHREAVFNSLPNIVNAIKAEVPIFGKELFGDEGYSWKVNR